MKTENDSKLGIEPRRNDESVESVKVTMKALKEFYGVRGCSKQSRLRAVGSEFGHIVARNISESNGLDNVLREIASFWNRYGLGEMNIEEGQPTTFTLRNCYDCIGTESGELLCGFKEGFVNAIINDRTGGIGSVQGIECCTMGKENCRFTVRSFQPEEHQKTELPMSG